MSGSTIFLWVLIIIVVLTLVGMFRVREARAMLEP
jgi:hypothetical protein